LSNRLTKTGQPNISLYKDQLECMTKVNTVIRH